MRKLFVTFLFFSVMVMIPNEALAAEQTSDIVGQTERISPRVVTLKQWFKGVPPKKYRGKTRIDYYRSLGGYIGVYL